MIIRSAEQLQNLATSTKQIIIYGASPRGKLLFEVISTWGLADKIVAFAVTQKGTVDSLCGVGVFAISELDSYRNDALVLISTQESFFEEIQSVLEEREFCEYGTVACFDELVMLKMGEHFEKTIQKSSKEGIDVLYFSSDNSITSGAFRSMVDLNVCLRKQGVKTLIVLPCFGDGESYLQEKELDYTYIPSEDWCIRVNEVNALEKKKRLEKNEEAIKKIEKLIASTRTKIVHINTSYSYVGAIAGNNMGIPVVWHIREVVEEQGFRFVDGNYAYRLMNAANVVITISHFMKGELVGLDQNKIQVIYNTVNVEPFFKERTIFDAGREAEICFVGAISRHKRQMDLIQAAGKLLRDGVSGFHISFVGSGDNLYLEELKKETDRLALSHHVSFLGKRGDVAAILHKSDIAVVASKEPFGRVTIEALAAGCLTVGADFGATPELIRDKETGYLYKHDNSDSLAQTLRYAMMNVELSRKNAENGQRFAKILYEQEKNADSVMRLYRHIMGENR